MASMMITQFNDEIQSEMQNNLWKISEVSLVNGNLKLRCESPNKETLFFVNSPYMHDETINLDNAFIKKVIVESSKNIFGIINFICLSIQIEVEGELYDIISKS